MTKRRGASNVKHEQRWNCKSLKRISFTSAADAPLIGTYEFVFTAN